MKQTNHPKKTKSPITWVPTAYFAIAELVYGHQRIQPEPLLADEQSYQQRQAFPYLSFLKRELEDKRLVQRSGTR